jgi:hypothetical protein
MSGLWKAPRKQIFIVTISVPSGISGSNAGTGWRFERTWLARQ